MQSYLDTIDALTYWVRHFLVLLILSSLSPSFAAQLTENDVYYKTHLYKEIYEVEEDGRFLREIEMDFEILKEAGRSPLSPLYLKYSHDCESLEVLEANTFVQDSEGNKKITEMIAKDINSTDKPLADSGNRRSKFHQISISFPNVHVGTHVYLKYIVKTTRPAYPNFFAGRFILSSTIFGYNSLIQHRSLEIKSKMKLYFDFKDRNDFFNENRNISDGYASHSRYELKRTMLQGSIGEDNSHLENNNRTVLIVSSLQNGQWKEFGDLNKNEIDAVIGLPLPAIFDKPIQDAQTASTTIDKINIITSWLASHLTYLTDSSTREGRLIPKDFSEIANHMQGDCKDYSALTIAMLKRIGITAYYSTVYSGAQYEELPLPESLPYHFTTHAIVKVVDGENVLWIDPTSSKSYAGGIFSDIEGRYALVSDEYPHIEQIPKATPKDSIHVAKVSVKLGEISTQVDAQIELLGNAAVGFTGAAHHAGGIEHIKRYLLSRVAKVSSTEDVKFEHFDLSSRIVKDLTFRFSYTELDSLSDTSQGQSYSIHPITESRLVKLENRTSAYRLADIPHTYISETEIFNNGKVVPLPPSYYKNCEVTSPWFDFKYSTLNKEDRLSIYQEKVVKRKLITLKELQSDEFKNFQDRLSACAKLYSIICTKDECAISGN